MTANLADDAFVSAVELPSSETGAMETPAPPNLFGARGIGGSTPTVQNAAVGALAPFGARHVDMPSTAARVRTATEEARGTS